MSAPDPRGVLDDLADRRRRCTDAIRTLAAFYLLDPAPWLEDAPSGNRKIEIPNLEDRNSKRARRVKGDTARPTQAPSEIQQRILEALKAADEPVSPGELAKALKVNVAVLRYHLKGLVKTKQVTAVGSTANRRLSVP